MCSKDNSVVVMSQVAASRFSTIPPPFLTASLLSCYYLCDRIGGMRFRECILTDSFQLYVYHVGCPLRGQYVYAVGVDLV